MHNEPSSFHMLQWYMLGAGDARTPASSAPFHLPVVIKKPINELAVWLLTTWLCPFTRTGYLQPPEANSQLMRDQLGTGFWSLAGGFYFVPRNGGGGGRDSRALSTDQLKGSLHLPQTCWLLGNCGEGCDQKLSWATLFAPHCKLSVGLQRNWDNQLCACPVWEAGGEMSSFSSPFCNLVVGFWPTGSCKHFQKLFELLFAIQTKFWWIHSVIVSVGKGKLNC